MSTNPWWGWRHTINYPGVSWTALLGPALRCSCTYYDTDVPETFTLKELADGSKDCLVGEAYPAKPRVSKLHHSIYASYK